MLDIYFRKVFTIFIVENYLLRFISSNTLLSHIVLGLFHSFVIFDSLRKMIFHLLSNTIKTTIATVLVAVKTENILTLCIDRTSSTIEYICAVGIIA